MATARDGVVSSQAALDEGRSNPTGVRGSRMAEQAPTAVNRGWVQSLAPIAVFDIAAPLVAYSLLRSSGSSAATALVISGVFPAFGVPSRRHATGAWTSSEPLCSSGSPSGQSSDWQPATPACCSSRARYQQRYSASFAWRRCGLLDP
jgi:hypothetical protein